MHLSNKAHLTARYEDFARQRTRSNVSRRISRSVSEEEEDNIKWTREQNDATYRHQQAQFARWRKAQISLRYSKAAVFVVVGVFCFVMYERANAASKVNMKRVDLAGSRAALNKPSWNILTPDPSIWSDDTWTYTVGNLPADITRASLKDFVPFLTYNFAHGSLGHLLAGSWGFYVLGSILMPQARILVTLALFTASRIAAGLLDAYVSQAYAQRRWRETFKLLKAGPDRNPSRTMTGRHLGSSSGICAMAAVLVLAMPRVPFGVPFVPISVPIWMLTAGTVAYDAYAFYNNREDSIGHSGHLAGFLCGAVWWVGILRWTRWGKMCRGII